MEFKDFIDRKDYLERVNNALQREKPQFIVIYGRRRIGKSKLIREIMDWKRKDIYFLSDQTNEANQRMLFAKTATMVGMEDFDKVTYPDWETLLRALNRQVAENSTVCLDEFPYLVKSCPSLPSDHTKAAQREMPEVQSYPLRFFTTTDAGLHIG